MEPTKTSITPTKTWAVLQSIYDVLPNSYYLSMESNPYVYRHNIYLVLAIAYLVIVNSRHTSLRKQWNQPRPVAPQARPEPCYKVYMMFFLIHTT
jgi:hypothetical protein